jgi:hypothetical protein
LIYFKDEGPLGKRINFDWSGGGWAQIIGVVGAVREMSLAAEAQPTVYAPMAQRGSAAVHSNIFMAVRSSGDPKMQAQAAKDVIHRLNGGQIVEHVRTMNEVINESVAADRTPMWLFGGLRRDRSLWRAFVLRSTTSPGNRHPNGVGREAL